VSGFRRSIDSPRYAFAGVRTTDVTPSIAHALGLSVTRGALVVRVEQGSDAERAGGDVILTVAGRRVDAAEGLARIVSEELHPGQTVTSAILRDGKRQDVRVRLGSRTP
jgi:serine protease Do